MLKTRTMRGMSLLAALLPAACAAPGGGGVAMIDSRADRSAIGVGLDSRDFESAAARTVQDMLESGALTKRDGGRYVLAISRVTNDTMQRFDPAILVKKIRVELLKSGKVTVTTAIGLGGPEDAMSMQVRQLRGTGEVTQGNLPGRQQLTAPDLSLSGKLIQLNNRLGDGTMRIDYEFQLSLTEVKSGLALWEGSEQINKLDSGRSVAW